MSGAIGIGQIGCGMIGQGHAYALRLLAEDGDIRPVAAADLSLEAVESAQRICPFERIGTDAYAVINDPDVQAVAIVTPTTTHLDLVRATLEAGKPLLCEKPLATDFATVREMCELVAASDTTAQVGFHSRFHPRDQRAARTGREQRARPADGLRPPRRPVLADGRHRSGSQLVAVASARTRAAARCSSTRSTAPTSSRGRSGRRRASTRGRATCSATTWRTRPRARWSTRRASSAPSSRSSTACAAGRSAGSRSSSNRARSRSRPTSSSARPRTASSSSDPTATANGSTWRRLRERYFDAAGITRRDFIVYLYPAARAFVRAVRHSRPASPGFADALRAHALVEAAYRSADERSAGGADGRPVDRLIAGRFVVVGREVDDVVDDEHAAQDGRRRSGSRAARHRAARARSARASRACSRNRTSALTPAESMNSMRSSSRIELGRVRGQSLEDASTDDTGGEHVEHAADSRGADAEVVVHDDYGGGVRHDPCLPLRSPRVKPPRQTRSVAARTHERGRLRTRPAPAAATCTAGCRRRGTRPARTACRSARSSRTRGRRRTPGSSRGSGPSLGERGDAGEPEHLVTGQPERDRRLPGAELEREHTHADEVRPVDALERLRDHRAHAEQLRALRGPVARAPGAVLLAREHDERHAFVGVAHRGVVDRRLLAVGEMHGERRPRCRARAGCAAARSRTCRAP